MNLSEFDLIEQYFTLLNTRNDVAVGLGDDCAALDVPTGCQLVSTIDTLISGTHFPEDTSAEDIAKKAVAVNLSDLAAMGAIPAWVSLAISLPDVDQRWLTAFSASLHQALAEYNVALIGGDTTKGHLSITIHAMGFVETGKAMLRTAAKPGDLIFVSGYLGDAALGLAIKQNKIKYSKNARYFIDRLNRPDARVVLGQKLKDYCCCAIDISDGLFSDLTHILNNSSCGALVNIDKLPLSAHAVKLLASKDINIKANALMSGDDYELCFTVSANNINQIQAISKQLELPLTCIGEITEKRQLRCINDNGELVDIKNSGFNHFSK